ncbi:MAG TPA: ATP-binding cassette domain-containing protein [Candidatus Limnocylindrales bacterium]|nr:ATP-binding cassette domain-containing protein [Candidatus Limnocylindrales bacterium]
MTRERPEIIDLDSRPIAAAPVDRVRPSGGPTTVHEAPAPAPQSVADIFEVPKPSGRILCEGLVKIYKVADLEVVALQGLDLHVEPGEFVAIIGASGSGKSTLMHILGGLDVPSAGRATVAGHDLTAMDRAARTEYRRRAIGFVWQQTSRNLLAYLTARQNVELPMLLAGVPEHERRGRAQDLLERVGLAERADHKPNALSGGEQQRVAIAVAIANKPAVLFADEPTGELDSVTAHEVFDLLRSLNQELGVTIVVVTHDPLVSEQVSRTIAIRDGRTSTETLRRRAVTEAGDHHVIAEEYAVLDRVGRLQLPRAQVEALGLERRVRLVLADDHIEIWPDASFAPPISANGSNGEGRS